jgi:molybdopterin molybdotransferase
VLSTGDELCRPGEPPGPSQIVSSNSTALCAAARAWGCVAVDLGIAADRADALAERLAAAAGLDLLLTSGGASVGDHDVVGQALGAARTTGSTSGRSRCGPASRCCSGGPGAACACSACRQPRLSLVCALVFARGAVKRMLGLDPALPREAAVLARGLAANDAREDYVRGRYVGRSPEGAASSSGRAAGQLHVRHLRRRRRARRPPPPRPAARRGRRGRGGRPRQAFLPFA